MIMSRSLRGSARQIGALHSAGRRIKTAVFHPNLQENFKTARKSARMISDTKQTMASESP
jgi:predicted ATPase